MHSTNNGATLYVVATPIGNLADITIRALETLQAVAVIYCEDTRRTAILCAHYSIKTPLRSCHSYNEQKIVSHAITRLQHGDSIAYVSDAGTPTISDPGRHLAAAAHANGFRVVPIGGISAPTALISASGELAHPYLFYGFLPRKRGKRAKIVAQLLALPYAWVLFESPYRILALCSVIQEIAPNRLLVVGRELTKKYEEILKGNADAIMQQYVEKKALGEFTVLVTNRDIG